MLRSVEEALLDPLTRLIVVGTPNETHFPLAMAAIEAGKHVVVDKPLASSSHEVRDLAKAAERKGVVLAPFHNRRWDGDFLTLKQLIFDQAMGRLVEVKSHFDRFRPHPKEGTWKESGNPANGMLFDLGPHLVDQALALFGTPETITASVRRDREGTAIEDAFDITLVFGAVRARLSATMIAAEPAPRFLVHGTRGSFRKYGLDPQEPALVAGASVPRLGSDQDWLSEPEAAWGELVVAEDPKGAPGRLTRTKILTLPGDYRGFYANVRDAINGEAALAVTPEDAWRVIRLLELARESSASGRTLPVSFA